MRDIYAGGGARMLGLAAYHFPRVLDKLMERLMFRMQKTGLPPYLQQENNLYRAGNDFQERAGAVGRVRETSLYTAAVMHPNATSTLLLGAGIVLAAFLASGSSNGRKHALQR